MLYFEARTDATGAQWDTIFWTPRQISLGKVAIGLAVAPWSPAGNEPGPFVAQFERYNLPP